MVFFSRDAGLRSLSDACLATLPPWSAVNIKVSTIRFPLSNRNFSASGYEPLSGIHHYENGSPVRYAWVMSFSQFHEVAIIEW